MFLKIKQRNQLLDIFLNSPDLLCSNQERLKVLLNHVCTLVQTKNFFASMFNQSERTVFSACDYPTLQDILLSFCHATNF